MELKVGDEVRLTEKGKSGRYKLWLQNIELARKGKAKILLIKYDNPIEENPITLILDGILNNKKTNFYLDELEKVEEEKEMEKEEIKEKLTLQEYADKYNVYTAQDKNGDRCSYKNKPQTKTNAHDWIDTKGEFLHVTEITEETIPFDGDWKDSLCIPKSLKDDKKESKEVEPKLEVTTSYKDPKWCLVSDNKEKWVKAILITDNSNLNIKRPYRAVYRDIDVKKFLKNEFCCHAEWLYAKPLPKKKYKAYEKFNTEWVDKSIITKKSKRKLIIVGSINNDSFVAMFEKSKHCCIYSFKQAFNEVTWHDGSPCGEEVLDK